MPDVCIFPPRSRLPAPVGSYPASPPSPQSKHMQKSSAVVLACTCMQGSLTAHWDPQVFCRWRVRYCTECVHTACPTNGTTPTLFTIGVIFVMAGFAVAKDHCICHPQSTILHIIRRLICSSAPALLALLTLQAFGRAFMNVPIHPAAKSTIMTPLVLLTAWLMAMGLRMIPGVKRVL